MKTKKYRKKLILNKKTIADLNNKKMNAVLGGGIETKKGDTCPWTCPYQYCFPYKTETTCIQCCP
jgi:natural product precursor